VNPEAQRIAIAEACGWTHEPAPTGGLTTCEWRHPSGAYRTRIPDYLSDLDAMHEAVLQCITTEEQCESFAIHLRTCCGVEETTIALLLGYWQRGKLLLNATAAQRAEAFLRALNLWTE
jgi:hypothetical protein